MARDAVPQAQELPQERFLDRAEQRHVRAILAAGQYGAERDQQQFMQIMAGIVLPRVNDLGKAGDEVFHGRASTLNPRLESSHASPETPVFNHQRHMRSPWDERLLHVASAVVGWSVTDIAKAPAVAM